MDQTNKLVSAEIIRTYFDPPLSLRTVREMQKRREIPYVKVGRLVFFDPERVLDHLRHKKTIQPRV